MRAAVIVFLMFISLGAGAARLCAQTVRIGVLGITHPTQLALRPVGAEALVVTVAERVFYLQSGSATEQIAIRVSDDSGMVLRIADEELSSNLVRAAGRNQDAAGFMISVPGKMSRRYRGTLEIKASGGELVPIVTMDIETAVASVVQAESLADSPLEALKAQAIVTRSYLAAGGGRHRDFDFCDLTHCQVLRETPFAGSRIALAVAGTRGMMITFREKIVAAMFTRSCGGHTLTPRDIGISSRQYPYFSVLCEFCHQHPVRWSQAVSLEDAATLATHREAARLAVARRLGWNTVLSNSFAEHPHGANVVLEGVGQGHGVGLCQRGANGMAQQGASFREIIDRYFPNTFLVTVRAVWYGDGTAITFG
jgi:stage II sporulation protein D